MTAKQTFASIQAEHSELERLFEKHQRATLAIFHAEHRKLQD